MLKIHYGGKVSVGKIKVIWYEFQGYELVRLVLYLDSLRIKQVNEGFDIVTNI